MLRFLLFTHNWTQKLSLNILVNRIFRSWMLDNFLIWSLKFMNSFLIWECNRLLPLFVNWNMRWAWCAGYEATQVWTSVSKFQRRLLSVAALWNDSFPWFGSSHSWIVCHPSLEDFLRLVFVGIWIEVRFNLWISLQVRSRARGFSWKAFNRYICICIIAFLGLSSFWKVYLIDII
jgi:hypothetical protein